MSSWDNRDDDDFIGSRYQDPSDYNPYVDSSEVGPDEPTVEVSSTSSILPEARPSVDVQGPARPQFRVRLDVRQFEPHEVTVQHDGDFVQVEGKHEEQTDEHGFICREFKRRYELPIDVNPDKLSCHWHPNHVLVIKADRDPLPQSNFDEDEDFVAVAENEQDQ